MATAIKIHHLQTASRWFMDGTFKVVKQPFVQLMSIHSFIKKGDCMKQVPLLFVLMSRRTRADYVVVFRALKDATTTPPVVEWIMLDFEAAAWAAIREEFPNIVLNGCLFHFAQSVYRKILSIGLGPTYKEKGDKYRFMRQLMALPFLPAGHIREAFGVLDSKSEESGCSQLFDLMSYMRRTWIEGMWRPENWSVFQQTVRTNNDIEGWHHRINNRVARVGPSMYILIPLLHEEAQTVEMTIQLVSEMELTRYQRIKFKKTHQQLFSMWDKYEDGEISTSRLFRDVSYIRSHG